MKLTTKSILLAGTLSLGAFQTAAASGWSLGVFAGQTKADSFDEVCSDVELQLNLIEIIQRTGQRFTCNSDDSDSALGLNLAYNFSDAWGIELGYVDLGEYSFEIAGLGESVSLVVDAQAPYIAGVGTLSISDKFSVSLRAGAFEASADLASSGRATGALRDEVSGDAQFYAGASLDYRFTDAVSAQLRYDNFDEFDVAGLGLKFHF